MQAVASGRLRSRITVACLPQTLGAPASSVSEARTELGHAPKLAGAVIDGTMALKAAYDIAVQRKRASQTWSN